MLTFFRRIRKSIFDSSQARKYFLYAIGEITLVVFGILIALQINNWNEHRKSLIESDQYRTGLLSDLYADTININRITGIAENIRKRINGYNNYFETDTRDIYQLLDSIDRVGFSLTRYIPVNFTFTDMQSSGKLGLLREQERRILMELAQAQEFFQIVLDRNINSWFSDLHETKKYLDMDYIEGDFYDQVGFPNEKSNLVKGLMHRHHMVSSNLNVTSVIIQLGGNVKNKTFEAITILEK